MPNVKIYLGMQFKSIIAFNEVTFVTFGVSLDYLLSWAKESK
jgi:hypothetical protein